MPDIRFTRRYNASYPIWVLVELLDNVDELFDQDAAVLLRQEILPVAPYRYIQ